MSRRVGDAFATRQQLVGVVSYRRRVGDVSARRWGGVGDASATRWRCDADVSSATRCIGVASATRRHRVVSASRQRLVGAASAARRVGNASPDDAPVSYQRGARVDARRVALSGWRGEKMMLKTCQSIWRARQGAGDALVTRGRRIGVASAMRFPIGDASAMRRVARDTSRWLYGEGRK